MMWRCLILASVCSGLYAQSEDLEFFEKRVRPLFASKCFGCHGDKVKMGGLSLSTAAGLMAMLESKLVVKGDPEHSKLYNALLYSEAVKMPPSGKLPADEISAVRTWIERGAPVPATPAIPAQTASAPPDQQHWAFQRPKPQQPPSVKQTNWVKSPIDRFILAKLEEKQIPAPPSASKTTLLRRVTFDLTGLPPTVEEIEAFLRDTSPDAFAKVVDRLLESPRYGERWGRHWLDVARYADSTGMDEDNLYPHAWRYRDYVVEAFNKDVPFDRFIQEQIAGDLLPAATTAERARNVIATGFLAIGPKPLAQQDRLQMIYDVVDEQIDTTTKAFLGLTVACARCHDHKFDPIPTTDYYGLASIFASTTSFRNQGRPGAISYMHYTPLDPAAHDRYQTHRWRTVAKQIEMEDVISEDAGRENALQRAKLSGSLVAAWKVLNQRLTASAAATEQNVDEAHVSKWLTWLAARDEKERATYLKKLYEATEHDIAQVAEAYAKAYQETAAKWDERLERWRLRLAREALQDRVLPERPKFEAEENPFFAATTFNGGPLELRESARVQYLRSEWKQLEAEMPEAPALASAVSDGPSIDQRVFVRGNLHSPGDPVAKHFPVVLGGEKQPPVKKGRGRLELAAWLVDRDNPLTARVMANRIWQWHFGEGLVRTPNNWGRTGEAPTHPELLDYLADRFIASGWSIKAMHRLILNSGVYQMSSKAAPAAREVDPGNRLFSRFNRVRMSVEQIRDAMLSLDSSLDPTMGGSLFPTGKGKRERIDIDESKRRTLYMPVRRGNIPTLLSTFDFGDATTASDGRARTNVAPQALFLINSGFVNERSQGLANRIMNDVSTDAERVRRAYRMALSRDPDGTEIDSALTYIAGLAQRLAGDGAKQKAFASFCHILVATNEFLYLE